MDCIVHEVTKSQTSLSDFTPYIYIYICVCMYIYTHTHLWVSLVAQLVKNPPAMQEILVLFLGQEDLLEKG